jgi:hypothetical protein
MCEPRQGGEFRLKRKKEEIDFCENTLKPLFEAIPFLESVKYRHGTNEFGKDFTFSYINPLNQRMNAGVQVKWGDIRGSSNSIISKIVNQIETAFGVPYKNKPEEGQQYYLKELYFICSGEYKNNAVEIIERMLKKCYNVHFLDGSDVAFLRELVAHHKTEHRLEERRTLNALLIEIDQNIKIAGEIIRGTDTWIKNKTHLLLRYRLNCIEKALELKVPNLILKGFIDEWNNLTVQNNLLNEIALVPVEDHKKGSKEIVCANAKKDIKRLLSLKSDINAYLESIE